MFHSSAFVVLMASCVLLKTENAATFDLKSVANTFGDAFGGRQEWVGQIKDDRLANLKTDDGLNNVRYVALRSSVGHQDRSGHTTILVQQNYPAPGNGIVSSHRFENSAGYSPEINRDLRRGAIIPLGVAGRANVGQVDGPAKNRANIIAGSSVSSAYSAPTPAINRHQTTVATVNRGAGVNDPLPSGVVTARQSPPGPYSSSHSQSSATNVGDRLLPNVDRNDGQGSLVDRDYPIVSVVSRTTFDCNGKREGGYYADVESGCQVFHVCRLNRRFTFVCPKGTVFDQRVFVCNWSHNVNCASSVTNYILNDQIGVARPSIHGPAATVAQYQEPVNGLWPIWAAY